MNLGARSPSPLSRLRLYNLQSDMVRQRKYRTRKAPKMELYRRRAPDYTELAYREAMAKLKYLLAESYTPVTIRKPTTVVAEKDESEPSTTAAVYPVLESRSGRPFEVSPFLRRQEEYIDQLEKEGQLYRKKRTFQEELNRMLDRLREAADKVQPSEEDESDREMKERSRRGRGPSIVYSSRISELEAQLTQVRLELRKAQDEAAYLKAHSKPIQPPVSHEAIQQLESLQRERDDLSERVTSLQTLVGHLRDKEASATQKVKRSLDVVDQAQYDKNQLEMEVRRLKSELERMSDKQREALQESARRVSEAERRYAMQIERLNGDLAAQWDAANRLNLELDRARRSEAELRRELAQKVNTIEELKKELLTKTGSLQNEALTASEEREKLESELTACRLSVERAERQGRQEVAKLQAEVQAVRSRLDRADQDLLHSRKENIRLADVIAGLEKELSLSKLTKDSAASKELKRADELTSMIKEMDAKHEETKNELEGLILSQTQLMEKLNAECQALTRRLEDSSARHKEEMANLQNNLEYISSKIEATDHLRNQEWRDNAKMGNYEKHTSEDTATSKTNEQFNPTENERKGSLTGSTKIKKEIQDVKHEIADIDDNKTGLQQNVSTDEKYNAEDITKKPEADYDQSNSYKTGEKMQYPQQNKYDQPEAPYDNNQSYDQSKEYTQEYDTSQQDPYSQDQAYNEQVAEGYVYDQTGGYEGQGYEQGQEYDQSGAVYDGSQGYNQELYDQNYDPNYQQSGMEYEQGSDYPQEGYEKGGDYPQGQGYEQGGDYSQGEGYEQGQVYTGGSEAYQPEEYPTTAQDNQNESQEQEYSHKEKT